MHHALEAAAEQTTSDAAMIMLEQGDSAPIVETYGLSNAESSQQLIGLPPDVSQARAVTIRYRYTEEEMANDEFRLMGGIAVPLFDRKETRTGTLAVFWRRTERDPGAEDVDLLEELVASFGPPIDARRYEEARRLADMDPVTGLQNERYFGERLTREVSRARRYERELALLLFRLEVAAEGTPLLTTVGRRVLSAVRRADVSCYLGDGRFNHPPGGRRHRGRAPPPETPVRARPTDRRGRLKARTRLWAPRASARGQCGYVHAPCPGNVSPGRSGRGAPGRAGEHQLSRRVSGLHSRAGIIACAPARLLTLPSWTGKKIVGRG